MKSPLKLVKPDAEKRAVAPTRLANSEYRSREHLTPSEVEKLIEAAKTNRHGHRDATMLLVAYRHGLRASELCELEWSQVDFNSATLHVRRAKNGKPATHPIRTHAPSSLQNIRLNSDMANLLSRSHGRRLRRLSVVRKRRCSL
jgi:integrase